MNFNKDKQIVHDAKGHLTRSEPVGRQKKIYIERIVAIFSNLCGRRAKQRKNIHKFLDYDVSF